MSGKSTTELSEVAQAASGVLGNTNKAAINDLLKELSGTHKTQQNGENASTQLPKLPSSDENADFITPQQELREAISSTVSDMHARSIHSLQPHTSPPQLPAFDATVAQRSPSPSESLPPLDGSLDHQLIDGYVPFDHLGNDTPFHESVASLIESEAPRIQAFAKLEFDDGVFYMNTYAVELGRDIRAARVAMARGPSQNGSIHNDRISSGGNASQNANHVKQSGSAVKSQISEKAGIMGVDPDPKRRKKKQGHGSNEKSHSKSTNSSSQRVTRKEEASQPQTNYQTLAMMSLDRPQPVQPETFLPSPEEIPLILIHPSSESDWALAAFRGISRKHVRIGFSFEKHLFEIAIKGRNGAFVDDIWYGAGTVKALVSGSWIQIGGISVRFWLPEVAIGETGAEGSEEDQSQSTGEAIRNEVGSDEDDLDDQESGEEEEIQQSVEEVPPTGKGRGKSTGKQPAKSVEGPPEPVQPPKKRGPGRPPKDGISSKREKAEQARAAKQAAKKAANGGLTPSPPNVSSKVKLPKIESVPVSQPETKPEKRKYTKRKKSEGELQPNGEAEELELEDIGPQQVTTKVERSESPDYGNESDYTPEQLAKPPKNYAYLIYDLLQEPPHKMNLKGIYRALKKKYPHFASKQATVGWQSSVRHNLNQHSEVFEKVEKSGKGWMWAIIPGATLPNNKRKTSPPGPPLMPPPPQQFRSQGPQMVQYPPQAGPSNALPPTAMPPQPPAPPPQQLQHHQQINNGYVPPPTAIPPARGSQSYTSPYQSPYGPPAQPPPQPDVFVPHDRPYPQGPPLPTPPQLYPPPPPLPQPPPTPHWITVIDTLPERTVISLKAFKNTVIEYPAQEPTVDRAIDRGMNYTYVDEMECDKAENNLMNIFISVLPAWGFPTEAKPCVVNITHPQGVKRPREDEEPEANVEGKEGQEERETNKDETVEKQEDEVNMEETVEKKEDGDEKMEQEE